MVNIKKNKILNCAVIGLGVGERHASVYLKHSNTRLVAVCDINKKKINSYKNNHTNKINFYNNYRDMIVNEDLELVSVASYDEAHFEQIIFLLENKINVVVEKPMCLTFNNLDKIFKLIKKYRVNIYSNLTLRGNRYFAKIKNDISLEKYGKIFYLSGDYIYGRIGKIIKGWRSETPNYSIILGGAIHLIDLLLWFNDKRVKSILAIANKSRTQNTNFKHKDFSIMLIKFEDNSIAKITANFASNLPHRHLFEIHGTKKSLFMDYNFSYTFTKPEIKNLKKIDIKKYIYDKEFIIRKNVDKILLNDKEETLYQFNLMSVCLSAEKSIKSGKWERVKKYYA